MERLYEELWTKYGLPLHLKKEQCDILQLLLQQKKDTFVVWPNSRWPWPELLLSISKFLLFCNTVL